MVFEGYQSVVNVIARLDFELAYNDITVLYVSHYNTPPIYIYIYVCVCVCVCV